MNLSSPFVKRPIATVLLTAGVALSGIAGLIGLVTLTEQGRPSPWLLWCIFAALSSALLMFMTRIYSCTSVSVLLTM